MMIIWWSKHVGVILSVLMCDIWINVLLQTRALVGLLHIVDFRCLSCVTCMLHSSFPSSLKAILDEQWRQSTKLLITSYARPSRHFLCVSSKYLPQTPCSHVHHSAKERIFIFCCFHPNQTQQITKEQAKSQSYWRNREVECVWEELFHFLLKAPVGTETRESLIQPKCADRSGKD
jgi:hypothetical protein